MWGMRKKAYGQGRSQELRPAWEDAEMLNVCHLFLTLIPSVPVNSAVDLGVFSSFRIFPRPDFRTLGPDSMTFPATLLSSPTS